MIFCEWMDMNKWHEGITKVTVHRRTHRIVRRTLPINFDTQSISIPLCSSAALRFRFLLLWKSKSELINSKKLFYNYPYIYLFVVYIILVWFFLCVWVCVWGNMKLSSGKSRQQLYSSPFILNVHHNHQHQRNLSSLFQLPILVFNGKLVISVLLILLGK